MKLRKLSFAIAISVASASANAFVSEWEWESSTGFLPGTYTADTVSSDNDDGGIIDFDDTESFAAPVTNAVTTADVYQYMAWGEEANPDNENSNILISNVDTLAPSPAGSNAGDWAGLLWGGLTDVAGHPSGINVDFNAMAMETDGDWQVINAFTHTNHIIDEVATWSIDIQGGFMITDPSTATSGDPLSVMFTETLNSTTSCSADPGNGVVNPLGTACDDFFRTGGLSDDLFITQEDGLNYWVTFDFFAAPDGDTFLSFLDDEVVIHTAEASTEGGYSPGVSTIFTIGRVYTTNVPEPAVVTLLGAGLLLLGGRRWKKGNI